MKRTAQGTHLLGLPEIAGSKRSGGKEKGNREKEMESGTAPTT